MTTYRSYLKVAGALGATIVAALLVNRTETYSNFKLSDFFYDLKTFEPSGLLETNVPTIHSGPTTIGVIFLALLSIYCLWYLGLRLYLEYLRQRLVHLQRIHYLQHIDYLHRIQILRQNMAHMQFLQ